MTRHKAELSMGSDRDGGQGGHWALTCCLTRWPWARVEEKLHRWSRNLLPAEQLMWPVDEGHMSQTLIMPGSGAQLRSQENDLSRPLSLLGTANMAGLTPALPQLTPFHLWEEGCPVFQHIS